MGVESDDSDLYAIERQLGRSDRVESIPVEDSFESLESIEPEAPNAINVQNYLPGFCSVY
jgi:hypothetical protein